MNGSPSFLPFVEGCKISGLLRTPTMSPEIQNRATSGFVDCMRHPGGIQTIRANRIQALVSAIACL